MNYPMEYPQYFMDHIGVIIGFLGCILDICRGSRLAKPKVMKP